MLHLTCRVECDLGNTRDLSETDVLVDGTAMVESASPSVTGNREHTETGRSPGGRAPPCPNSAALADTIAGGKAAREMPNGRCRMHGDQGRAHQRVTGTPANMDGTPRGVCTAARNKLSIAVA